MDGHHLSHCNCDCRHMMRYLVRAYHMSREQQHARTHATEDDHTMVPPPTEDHYEEHTLLNRRFIWWYTRESWVRALVRVFTPDELNTLFTQFRACRCCVRHRRARPSHIGVSLQSYAMLTQEERITMINITSARKQDGL